MSIVTVQGGQNYVTKFIKDKHIEMQKTCFMIQIAYTFHNAFYVYECNVSSRSQLVSLINIKSISSCFIKLSGLTYSSLFEMVQQLFCHSLAGYTFKQNQQMRKHFKTKSLRIAILRRVKYFNSNKYVKIDKVMQNPLPNGGEARSSIFIPYLKRFSQTAKKVLDVLPAPFF